MTNQIDFSRFQTTGVEPPSVPRAPEPPRPGWPEPRGTITLEEELASRGIDVVEINDIIISIYPVGTKIDIHDVIDSAEKLPPRERAYFLAGMHEGLILGSDQ